MGLTFSNESAEYRVARERLLAREIELRRLTEAVARERRAPPAGGAVPEDYVFEAVVDGAARKVRLSELFAPGKDTPAIYSYMFAPERERPCSMCTPLLDGLNAAELEHPPAARWWWWRSRRQVAAGGVRRRSRVAEPAAACRGRG